MAKRVTIDRLAEMVVNGFQELQDEMRRGFNEVAARFNDVYRRFDAVDARFDDVYGRFDGVNARLERIERKLDGTIERVDDHGVRLARLEKAKE